MTRKRLTGAIAVLVALCLLLAGAGWDRYVVERGPVPARLARLIVAPPPAGYTSKPSDSHSVTADSNPFAAYKSAARSSPGATGSYSISWSNPKQSGDSVTVLLSYLPTDPVAAKVQAQAQTQYEAADSFKSGGYASAGTVAVPGVPGAKGAVFVSASTSAASSPPVATVAFATGRVQILVILAQTGAPVATGRTAATFALSVYDHLRAQLGGFRLGRTSVPLVATAVYWGVVAVILVLAVGTPLAVRRARRRRFEASRRVARQQHQVRGSKIARRQASRHKIPRRW